MYFVNKVKQHLYSSFVYCKGFELLNKSYISIWIVWKNHLNNQTMFAILCCIFVSFYFQFVLSSVILSPPLDSVKRISYKPESQPIFYLSFPYFAANFSTPDVCSISSLPKLCFLALGQWLWPGFNLPWRELGHGRGWAL